MEKVDKRPPRAVNPGTRIRLGRRLTVAPGSPTLHQRLEALPPRTLRDHADGTHEYTHQTSLDATAIHLWLPLVQLPKTENQNKPETEQNINSPARTRCLAAGRKKSPRGYVNAVRSEVLIFRLGGLSSQQQSTRKQNRATNKRRWSISTMLRSQG